MHLNKLSFRDSQPDGGVRTEQAFLGRVLAWARDLPARLSLVPLFLLAACSGEPDLIEDWAPVPHQNFPLDFAAPGLEGRIPQCFRAVERQYGRPVVNTTARWIAFRPQQPEAGLDLLRGGAKFVRSMDAEGALFRTLDRLTEGEPEVPRTKGRDRNAQGAILYIHLQGDGRDCLVFAQEWRRGRVVFLLVGYYCAPGDEELTSGTIQAVLAGISEK